MATVSDGVIAPARLTRVAGLVLTVGGLLGALAAAVLTVEKFALAADPFYVPSCSIDATLSCGSVMASAQAAAFGFPNSVIGVAAFPVVATAGVLLLAGVALPRWFWRSLTAGAVLGVGFVHWLFVQSVYEIGALCPYCMVVWVSTISIGWYTVVHGVAAGHLPASPGVREALTRHHVLPQALWLLTLLTLVVQSFWFYFSALF